MYPSLSVSNPNLAPVGGSTGESVEWEEVANKRGSGQGRPLEDLLTRMDTDEHGWREQQ